MPTLTEMEQKVEALKLKQERAADAAEAMHQFEAEKANILNNTLRLRALRLSREAQEQELEAENKATGKAALKAMVEASKATARKATPRDKPVPAKKTKAGVKKAS